MFNQVILIGNLGDDPDVKTFDNGGKMSVINIATTKKWKDQNGEKQERTDWHRIEVTGNAANVVENYCKKGDRLQVVGSLRKEVWDDNDGNKRSMVKVRANQVLLLSNKSDSGSGQSNQSVPANPAANNQNQSQDIPPEDLPF